jgi:hypothetical protein
MLLFLLIILGPFLQETSLHASISANGQGTAIGVPRSFIDDQPMKRALANERLSHMPPMLPEIQRQPFGTVECRLDFGGSLAINTGDIAYAGIEIDPLEPMHQDVVTVEIFGEWIYGPRIILGHGHAILGNIITIHLYTEEDPWGSWWFSVTEQIGELSEGEYEVLAVVHEQMAPPETIATATFWVFPATPATLEWGPDVELTNDDLSDSAPAAAVYGGKIHVLWNHSYGGEIRHGLLDSAGWHELGSVADCPTGSGPSIVAFRDSVYAFYPQGEYPVYHLFGKTIIPDSPQFQLTFGNVFDRYGAAAVVYQDALYLFWKRWVSTGYRHILYMTFDGQSWSQQQTITDDGYLDSRPAVAVYDNKLFLFYRNGASFRTFDGSDWSDESSLVTGADENITPAVCTSGNKLYLFLRHNGQLYYKQFNDSTWTAARPIPSSPADEVRDLASVANNGRIYLLWGSYYSWSRSELYCKDATSREYQMIALHEGWQWVSTNVDPDPCKMESMFVDCWGDLDIAIACDGSFCIPGVGCWIDCWNVLEMYKIHMGDACTIQVRGSRVPTDTPIPLPAAWNCIAYFPECHLEPETALVSIWDNLLILISDGGYFCIPGIGCWIECMEPNEGYKVLLANADTLIYPTSCPPCPPPFTKTRSFPGFAQTTHFNYLGKTGESYSIVVNSVKFDGQSPEAGDEIGVFAPSGLCVGAGAWHGDMLGIAAWQDDKLTEAVDGFKIGEQMVFKLWDKSNNTEIELEPQFQGGNGEFGKGPYAVVSLKGTSSSLPKTFSLSQNYPNPFNPTTVIKYTLPVECHVKITIYNILGQKVKTLVNDHQPTGYKRVEWDSKNERREEVASGIYFYKIEAGEFTQSKKMVILK